MVHSHFYAVAKNIISNAKFIISFVMFCGKYIYARYTSMFLEKYDFSTNIKFFKDYFEFVFLLLIFELLNLIFNFIVSQLSLI